MSGRRNQRPTLRPISADGWQKQHPPRLVSRNPSEVPLRLGSTERWNSDLYHHSLTLPWWVFLTSGIALYLTINVVFAVLYMMDPDGIDKARAGSFADAFFFSVQTMATIGYGTLSPSGIYANLLVTAQTIVSLIYITLMTGITFSRFSRPTARVRFSRVATVSDYNGVPTLSVRMANGRRNQILEANVALTLVRIERTQEGMMMRRFYDLALERQHTPIFSLTFTAMHCIGPDSPIYGSTAESLTAEAAELLVTVTGMDETMSQTIHARISYVAGEILFGQRFVDMFGQTPEGRLAINYGVFHDVAPAIPTVGELGSPPSAVV